MTEFSPGARSTRTPSSTIQRTSIDDEDVIHSLKVLLGIFQSSLGPNGQAKLLRNNCGGQPIITSCSSRILSALSITKPYLKLVTAALQDHARLHCDGVLLAGTLSVNLMLKSVMSKQEHHRNLVAEIYNFALKTSLDFLQEPTCACKSTITFQETNILKKYVECQYKSKPSCLIYAQDLQHIVNLTLEGYLNSLHNESLTYFTLEGKPVEESRLLEGILFEAPKIPTNQTRPLNVAMTESSIRIILVEESMAGDSDNFLDAQYETSTTNISHDELVLEELLKFVERLVDLGVGMLACQRVIHPQVKHYLKQAGIFVLDRLGRAQFTSLSQVTGGNIQSPFGLLEDVRNSVGHLGTVEHVIFNNKSYIWMKGPLNLESSAVYTVIICHRTPEALAELKAVFVSTQHQLSQLARQPEVLCGGGCWQTCVAHHLRKSSQHKTWSKILSCEESTVKGIVDYFISVLENSAVSLDKHEASRHIADRQTGHHFITVEDEIDSTCQCGCVSYPSIDSMEYYYLGVSDGRSHDRKMGKGPTKKSCQVLEGYSVCVNVLNTAVGISTMLLQLQNYISN